MRTVISACSVRAHVTVALAAVTIRPDTVLVDAQMAGRVTTVKTVAVILVLPYTTRPITFVFIANIKKLQKGHVVRHTFKVMSTSSSNVV